MRISNLASLLCGFGSVAILRGLALGQGLLIQWGFWPFFCFVYMICPILTAIHLLKLCLILASLFISFLLAQLSMNEFSVTEKFFGKSEIYE